MQTVRGIILCEGKMLMLKKSAESNIPGAFEFPGGKVDEIMQDDFEKSLLDSVVREVYEETGIKTESNDWKRLDCDREINFFHKAQNKILNRKITYFLLELKKAPDIIVDKLLQEDGKSEDKHEGFEWIFIKDYSLGKLKISGNSQIPPSKIQA